jgi:predicted methyltransferase
LLNEAIIVKNLNICPGQVILDAGCGNGYMTKKFSPLVGKTGRIYAIDTDAQAIAKLKKEVGKPFNIDALATVNIHKKETPLGPPLNMRSSPVELIQQLSFVPKRLIEVGDYFYMPLYTNIDVGEFSCICP